MSLNRTAEETFAPIAAIYPSLLKGVWGLPFSHSPRIVETYTVVQSETGRGYRPKGQAGRRPSPPWFNLKLDNCSQGSSSPTQTG